MKSPDGASMQEADVAIIGGGIAGASAAYELAAVSSVILLERESHCGYHSTGRSAASFTENYGNAVIRRLAIASRSFLEAPPEDFCDHPLMLPRGMLTIARQDQLGRLEEELEKARQLVPSIHRVSPEEAMDRVPVLRADYLAGAIVEPGCREIDVNELHQGFLRNARKRGGRIVTNAGVDAIERHKDRWILQTNEGLFAAPIVVNAAGAWADRVAALAKIAPIGLVPKRRTAFHVAAPDGVAIAGWPLVNDVGEEFYFKPDAGRIFVSPADATPSEPMDAFPDDFDVAVGVDRLQRATTIDVRRIEHQWAGLRSFVSDASPVVGFDDKAEGFFWLAGQGGYGIKTSPALARACRDLIRTGRLPDELLRQGIEAGDLAPGRIRTTFAPEEKAP
ncbi:FAD-binding oxidoreductase [Mesorhizobium sp.]|uniref:NAD(P)/FAD-dependent oxidoreductase n=1 Tax=Mesorhizobium sp. TaxID=1871066 RepID=UPI000FE72FD5|nr:FAD-binding oxidoreductase [Mesorhizobium sp.]RWC47204.1 MAG: FAD-binding oxidoreductase [Mesorhizobium sp.]RWE90692.1 MAG: FAD-binding oxidoreductase [Mesorhizobium sp.]